MVPNKSAVIDQETYELLRDLMGEEGFEEILSFFCSDTQQAIQNLQQAVAEQQAEYVGGICHKLKSSSKLVGANNMAELSSTLEAYTEHKNQAEATHLVQQLEAEFIRVRVQIEHLTAIS